MGSYASDRLHEIATRLRAEGERGLTRRMYKNLRGAAGPMVEAVRASATEKLPKSGGLNLEQADQDIRIQVVNNSRTADVRLRTKTRGSMQTDKGYVRHPTPTLMGYHRSYWDWVEQEIPQAEGWWTDTLKKGAPLVQAALLAEMNKIVREIEA